MPSLPSSRADRTARTTGRRADAPDERGVSLILALVMLLVGVVVVGALASEVANDLSNTKA
ncbi:MAG TPA: hypothetical protein VKT18_09040, partial [Acidimicrobiales bacterium]|nr:hypothetical protein [Acidimicrobiales bacterium]